MAGMNQSPSPSGAGSFQGGRNGHSRQGHCGEGAFRKGLEPKNKRLTKKEALEKLDAEFVRVSAHYCKEKSEYYEGYREGLSQALWFLKKIE